MRLIDIDKVTPLDIMHNVICDKEVAHKMLDFLQSQPTVQPQGIDKDRLIEELKHLRTYEHEVFRNGYCEDITCFEDADVIRIINQQPTSDGWILVSSGELPKEEEDVLIQWGQYNDMSTARIRDGEWYVHGIFLQKIGNPQIITAWMPLPQPYKESENNV